MTSFSRHWDGLDGDVSEAVYGTTGKSNCRDMGSDGLDPYVQEHIDLVKSVTGEGPITMKACRWPTAPCSPSWAASPRTTAAG